MSKGTKACPFCGEEILEAAKKCRYCGEWFTDKEEINEPIVKLKNKEVENNKPVVKTEKVAKSHKKKNLTKRKISWFKIGLGLIYVALVITMGLYEMNAQKILSHAQKTQSMKKYKTASIGYQVVIEKFYLSFASISAKENFRKIRTRGGINSNKRLETTFVENYTDKFNPYLHYGMPLIVCPIYCIILLIMFIAELCRFRLSLFRFVWAGVFGGLFVIQLIEYKMIEYLLFPEFAHLIMSNPQILFISCYLLIIIGMIRNLIPRKGEK